MAFLDHKKAGSVIRNVASYTSTKCTLKLNQCGRNLYRNDEVRTQVGNTTRSAFKRIRVLLQGCSTLPNQFKIFLFRLYRKQIFVNLM